MRKILRILGGLLLFAGALSLWAFWIEPGRLVVIHENVKVQGWGAPTRIAALSDLHIGSRRVDMDQLREIVRQTNEEKPGLIVITGDFVTGGPRRRLKTPEEGFYPPELIAAELKEFKAPVYAVLGNHDWWFDGERVTRALRTNGVTVLENEAVRVPQGFWLGGIADLWTRNPDVLATLAQVTDDAPVVLFTHNPDVFPVVPERVGLMIAGHTHGGQVQLPFVGELVTTSKYGYNEGRFEDHGRQLFVTTGIGTSIIGARFGVPPEIAILNVTAKPQ